jgi:hypothetical protein
VVTPQRGKDSGCRYPKPAPDAPASEWAKWHASSAPPRSRDFYDSMSRILGVDL